MMKGKKTKLEKIKIKQMFVVALNTNDHTTYDSINLNTIHDF
jgi:hypothetical protein